MWFWLFFQTNILYISLGSLACLVYCQNTEDERGRWAAVLTFSVCEHKTAWMCGFSACRHVWCVYLCSYQIHWHTCAPESHPFSFHCHKEDKLESVLKQRKCSQTNSPSVSKYRVILTKCFRYFVYFGVCPKLFLRALLWKVCNWLLTAGNQSQCSFLSKWRESKLVQLSLIISPSDRLRDFLLAFFYFC